MRTAFFCENSDSGAVAKKCFARTWLRNEIGLVSLDVPSGLYNDSEILVLSQNVP